jgi:hypothetical protein
MEPYLMVEARSIPSQDQPFSNGFAGSMTRVFSMRYKPILAARVNVRFPRCGVEPDIVCLEG